MGDLQQFTVHLNFLAEDEEQAIDFGEAYAEALTFLRGEVDGYTTEISSYTDWTEATHVFCGAPGPDRNESCIRRVHAPGEKHRSPVFTWTDDEIPTAPDTPAGL